jgi:hypothetical protein
LGFSLTGIVTPLIISKSNKEVDPELQEKLKHLAIVENNRNGWNNEEMTLTWLNRFGRVTKSLLDTEKLLFGRSLFGSLSRICAKFSQVYR